MHAVSLLKRRSTIALAAMLLGALFTVPSAVAQGGGGADRDGGGVATLQRFLILGTDPAEDANPVVLGFGPIHAKGVDKAVSNHKDIFSFPGGDLIVMHEHASRSRDHDPVTCLFTFSERGSYKVVRGTGDYAGVEGHGHYVLDGKFVACDEGQPDAFVIEIQARGPLKL